MEEARRDQTCLTSVNGKERVAANGSTEARGVPSGVRDVAELATRVRSPTCPRGSAYVENRKERWRRQEALET